MGIIIIIFWRLFINTSHYIPSGNSTWPWKITMFNGKIHYKWAIFNGYVKLPEGSGLLRTNHQPTGIFRAKCCSQSNRRQTYPNLAGLNARWDYISHVWLGYIITWIMYVYIYIYVCMYIYICVCIYICMYIYICMMILILYYITYIIMYNNKKYDVYCIICIYIYICPQLTILYGIIWRFP